MNFFSARYFTDIVDGLVKQGYTRNVNVRGAPYDFRKAPSKFVLRCDIFLPQPAKEKTFSSFYLGF